MFDTFEPLFAQSRNAPPAAGAAGMMGALMWLACSCFCSLISRLIDLALERHREREATRFQR